MAQTKAIIVTLSFIVLILVSNSGYLFDVELKENLENRTLAPCPEFNIHHLDPFPVKFESYYNDHFNYRDLLLKWNTYIKVNIFGESPHKSTIIGKDGFLFHHKYLNSYTGLDKFSQEELDFLKTDYTERIKWLNERNIKHYIVIVPSKYNCYPEKLPFRIQKYSGLNQTEQFIKSLQNIEGINLIYLKDTLTSMIQDSKWPLYYNTDQHWNRYGAFIGYSKIISEIRKDFPSIQAVTLDQLEITSEKIDGKGLAKRILVEKDFTDIMINIKLKDQNFKKVEHKNNFKPFKNFPYKEGYQKHYKSNNDSLPKIVFIRDSYANAMTPYFPATFSKTTIIWDNWNYGLNKHFLEEEKPDILLTMLIESNLKFIIYKHPNERD